MAVGIVEVGKTASAISQGIGNPVMILGSSTGRDGIHGASLLASREFDEKTEDMRPTVQVGDPFAEKMLLEASLELIASGCVVGMQDMGAAGICCSTSEMSAKGKSGMSINLDLVPLRESSMSAYEIMLSESQERMLVVVEKGKEHIAQSICDKWDVPIATIGEVTGDGILRFTRDGKQVTELQAEHLVLGGLAPQYEREWKIADYVKEVRDLSFIDEAKNTSLEHMQETLKVLLSSTTISSKRWVFEQYDSQVRTNTVAIKGDAAVMRIKELPGKGFAVCTDCNSRYVYLNPYVGGMMAVAEAARNVVCTGALPVAITNCLNFGNPYDPEVYWQFREAIRGMGDMCRALDTPVTGGNVSFHNESKNHAVFPTPTIGMLGLIDDMTKVIGSGFVDANDVIVLLGRQSSDIGGSEYLKQVYGKIAGDAPYFILENEVALQKATLQAIQCGLIKSAHDISEGGLAICLVEKMLASALGADIELPFDVNVGNLFGEGQSRIIVTTHMNQVEALRLLCNEHGVETQLLGKVTSQPALSINASITLSSEEARSLYEGTLPSIMATELHS